MNPSRKKRWLTVAPAMCLPFLASLFYFVLFSEHVFARVIYGATKVFTLVWPLAVVLLIFKQKLPRPDWRDLKHLKAVLIGLIAGIGVVLIMLGLMLSPVALVVVEAGTAIGRKSAELGILNHYWTFAIFLSVFHSLLEEYYWRWFVYGQLRALVSGKAAHLLGAASFAAHHIVITTQFFPFGWGVFFGSMVGVGGLIFSLLYDRQKSLMGAWIAHMVVDFGIMAIGYELIR